MSIDTYFCFCCLSTNGLSNLFSNNSDINYVTLLEDLFKVKPTSSEYEEDSYICEDCCKKLVEATQFKTVVFDTLNALQVNRLINLEFKDGHHIVSKVYDHLEVDKFKPEVYAETAITNKTEPNPIDLKPTKQELTDALERDKHKPKKRRKREKQSTPSYKVADDLKCTICGVVLVNVYCYHRHMNYHYPNHICETCGKGFLTERRLKRHIPSHSKGPFKCQSCDAVFSNYNTYNGHRQRKHGSVPLYRCPERACGARFPTLWRRAAHLASHRRAQRLSCALCPSTFLVSGNLASHMRSKHLKIKRHYCSECGAGFFKKDDLRGHMSSHTGVYEYVCALCPKRYPRKKALTVHMRTHNDDRRFCCDICGKKFIQKCTLLSHFKVHSRERSAPETPELFNKLYDFM